MDDLPACDAADPDLDRQDGRFQFDDATEERAVPFNFDLHEADIGTTPTANEEATDA